MSGNSPHYPSAIRTIFYYFHLRMNAYKIGRRFFEKVFRTSRIRKKFAKLPKSPVACSNAGNREILCQLDSIRYAHTSTLRTISQSFREGVGFAHREGERRHISEHSRFEVVVSVLFCSDSLQV